MNEQVEAVPLVRAAQYIRMSTEYQQYSTENQADIVRDYAAKRGREIVRTYADAGKSGLNIKGREALQRLIAEVQNENATFRQSSSTTLADGDGSKTQTKARITNTSANAPASPSNTAQSNLKMTVARPPPSSRV